MVVALKEKPSAIESATGDTAKFLAELNNSQFSLFGSIVSLMQHSEYHLKWSLEDLHRLVVPPIGLKQCQVWFQDQMPVSYVSWAYLTAEAEESYVKGKRLLTPQDWRAGDKLWLIDVVAPFGGARKFLMDLRDRHPGVSGKALRRDVPVNNSDLVGKIVDWTTMRERMAF